MITNNFIDLLNVLVKTDNPTTKYQAVLTYCALEDKEEDLTDKVKDLLTNYSEAVERKREQGVKAYKARNKTPINPKSKKNKNKDYKRDFRQGRFFSDYHGGGICSGCYQEITPGNVFRQKINGDYINWHIVCVPEQHKKAMIYDKNYKEAMSFKPQNNEDIIDLNDEDLDY